MKQLRSGPSNAIAWFVIKAISIEMFKAAIVVKISFIHIGISRIPIALHDFWMNRYIFPFSVFGVISTLMEKVVNEGL